MAAAERPEPLRKKRSGGLGSMLRRPATVLSPQSTRAFNVTLCEAAAAPPQWVILRVSPVRAADQPAEKPFSCCMHVAYVRKGGPQGVLTLQTKTAEAEETAPAAAAAVRAFGHTLHSFPMEDKSIVGVTGKRRCC